MKGNKISITLFFTLFISTAGIAQSRFFLEVQGGSSINSLSQGVMSDWGNGWTIGTGLAYSVAQQVDVGVHLSYDRYPYVGNSAPVTMPAVAGLHYSVAGEPLSSVDAAFFIRFNTIRTFVMPYITLSAGIYHAGEGKMTVSRWFESNPGSVSSYSYNGSGYSSTNVFGSVAFGLMVPVDSRISMSAQGSFEQSFNSTRTLVPVVVALRYAL